MPSRKYKCTNVAGGCEHAFTKELIELEEGAEFECPSKLSGCSAQEITGKSEKGPGWPVWKKAAVAAGVVAALGVGATTLIPKTPDPDAANQMLSDFFPGLKK
jgi:hypothetical protein